MGISDIIQDVGRSLSKGINNLFNIPSEVNVAYPVHAEIIRRDDQIKNLVRKLRTVEGQFAREQADRIQREEEEKKRDFQEELKEELHKQKQGIEKQKYQKTFSWGKLFLKMFTDKRYKGQIEIQDKDGEVTFGFLEDYLFTDDGLMALTLKGGEIISIGRTPNELIYKPQSLVNQLRKKIIQIPVDKNRRYVPDIEQMETYDVIRDEDGNYKQATEKLYLVKEKLIEYNEIIEDKSERIQNLETQTEEMKSTISDLKMANVATSKSSEMAETRLSQALQKMMAMQINLQVSFSNYHLTKLSYLQKFKFWLFWKTIWRNMNYWYSLFF